MKRQTEMPSQRFSAEVALDPTHSTAPTPCGAAGGGRPLAAPVAQGKAPAFAVQAPRKRTWLALWAPVLLKLALAGAALTSMAAIGVLSQRFDVQQQGEQWRLVEKSNPTLVAQANAAPLSSSLEPSAPPVTASAVPSSSAAPAPEPKQNPTEQKIILNTATAEELQKLPGVGQKRAQAIIDLRSRLKGFKRLTDLLRVRGIGPRSLKRMLPLLELNPAPALVDAGAGK